MKYIQFFAKRIQTGSKSQIAFNLSVQVQETIWNFVKQIKEKYDDNYVVKISPPKKPRSKGYRSQQHRIRGSCAAISEQVNDKRWTSDTVYRLMKASAVAEGVFPYIESKDPKCRGIKIAISESDASMEDDNGLIIVINEFADRHDMWLWEYTDDEKKYKSLGGRSLDEMNVYYPELNKNMEDWNK